MGNSPRTGSIHILDDDSLLHVFYLYRPFLSGEDEDDNARFRGGDAADGGGISLRTFAKDGETSFLAQRPTWAFSSSVHMARPLQTCWHIHLPFHSSFNMLRKVETSPQMNNRE
jgi:hypothetical protein